jgi:hypothetical protein
MHKIKIAAKYIFVNWILIQLQEGLLCCCALDNKWNSPHPYRWNGRLPLMRAM